MKILVVTYGLSNRWMGGVSRYFRSIAPIIEKNGHKLCFFDGDVVLKAQPGVLNGMAFITRGMGTERFARCVDQVKPDCVHIQAEFGIGIGARNFCAKENIPFSSAYHTNFDRLVELYHVPSFWVWPYLRWFYKPASVIFTHTQTLKDRLQNRDIQSQIATFLPGVDGKTWFYQPEKNVLEGYPRPYFATMARMSKEKQIHKFLELELPGTKFVIGEGPEKEYLMKKYAGKAVFLPYDRPRQYLNACDVFVIPSDFGALDLVILEALACGLPIAAGPVMGPIDVVEQGVSGCISTDLQEAALACLSLQKNACIQRASEYTWENTAEAFVNNQVRI